MIIITPSAILFGVLVFVTCQIAGGIIYWCIFCQPYDAQKEWEKHVERTKKRS